MKKIYKSLTVAAFALMANVAFGQNLKITSNGNPVANGDVIEVPFVLNEDYYPEYDLTFYSANWDPHLFASTVDGEANMTVTLSSVNAENPDNFQLCWPGSCIPRQPGQTVSSSGTIKVTPEDMQIHMNQALDSKEELLTVNVGGPAKVRFVSGFESLEITLNPLAVDSGVGENLADSNAPTVYYTLEGLKVENPTKGIYVARKGGKARLIYKK